MESELLARCRKLANRGRSTVKYQALPQQSQNQQPEQTEQSEARKEKFTFTIGYAFGWALTFEGFFSALYHLCPSKLTFQF